MLALQYHLSHDLPIMRARPFNHIGPGQNDRFVAPAFAKQIAAIEEGAGDPVIYVGNLEAKRDFTDVRDIVRAYHMIVEWGHSPAKPIISRQARRIAFVIFSTRCFDYPKLRSRFASIQQGCARSMCPRYEAIPASSIVILAGSPCCPLKTRCAMSCRIAADA